MEIEIIKIQTPPIELLLLADESQASIDDYINRGECYAAQSDDEVVGEYILLHTRPFTAEIVNIAVLEQYQRCGIGCKLIQHAISTAREAGYHLLEIGTGDSGIGQIALYERCGFCKVGIDKDYFIQHYPAPIFENDIQCRDMVRLQMKLL